MFDKLTLILLGVGGLAAVFAVVAAALAQLRDELVSLGWIREASALGRMSIKAQSTRLTRTLRGVGLPQEYLDALKLSARTAVERSASQARHDDELSVRLLRKLKVSTRTLDYGFRYDETGEYYIDVMGDMYFRDEDDIAEYSRFLYEWLRVLESRRAIPVCDCLLGNKNGCVVLAQQLRSLMSPSLDVGLMVARASDDRSRVSRIDPNSPHRTDIEGLEAFLRLKADDIQAGRKYRVLFVDDSCTGAKNLHDSVVSFNSLVSREQLPLYPITDAVVLFAIKSEKAEERCQAAALALHAVVALGRNEIRTLLSERDSFIRRHVATFKRSFACVKSREFGI